MKAFLTLKILTNLTKINGSLANLEFTLRKRNFQEKNMPEDTLTQIKGFAVQNDAQDRRHECFPMLK